MLDVDVSEELFEIVTCAFSGPIRVQYADSLRAIATEQMFVDCLGVDTVEVLAGDGVVDAADGVV